MGVVPRDSVMCPFFFVSDPTKLTEEELTLARRFATQEEIVSWQQFGLYLGYRVGIEPSGEWIFFVAGD